MFWVDLGVSQLGVLWAEVSLGWGLPGPRFIRAGLPGQAWGLQSWYSAASPTQGRPPLRGSGFVHVLLRTRKPSSQSREQDDHGPQAAQPPLTVFWPVPPLRRRSSTRAGGRRTGLNDKGFFQTLCCAQPELPRPGTPSLALSLWAWEGGWRVVRAWDCTVGVAGSRAVRRTSSGLHPPPAKLQAVGVRQRRAAREAESLLLSRPALSHVHR